MNATLFFQGGQLRGSLGSSFGWGTSTMSVFSLLFRVCETIRQLWLRRPVKARTTIDEFDGPLGRIQFIQGAKMEHFFLLRVSVCQTSGFSAVGRVCVFLSYICSVIAARAELSLSNRAHTVSARTCQLVTVVVGRVEELKHSEAPKATINRSSGMHSKLCNLLTMHRKLEIKFRRHAKLEYSN